MWNGLSGKTENLDKICFKLSFAISSADKDTVKTFDSFNRMHMIWIDRV